MQNKAVGMAQCRGTDCQQTFNIIQDAKRTTSLYQGNVTFGFNTKRPTEDCFNTNFKMTKRLCRI